MVMDKISSKVSNCKKSQPCLNWDGICRTCMKPRSHLLPFNSEDSNFLTYYDKLRTCLPELSNPAIYYKGMICKYCSRKLSLLYNFRKTCINTYDTLERYIQEQFHNKMDEQNMELDTVNEESYHYINEVVVEEQSDENNCDFIGEEVTIVVQSDDETENNMVVDEDSEDGSILNNPMKVRSITQQDFVINAFLKQGLIKKMKNKTGNKHKNRLAHNLNRPEQHQATCSYKVDATDHTDLTNVENMNEDVPASSSDTYFTDEHIYAKPSTSEVYNSANAINIISQIPVVDSVDLYNLVSVPKNCKTKPNR